MRSSTVLPPPNKMESVSTPTLHSARAACNTQPVNAKRTTHPAVRAIQGLLDERGINKSDFARQLGWGRMQVHRRLNGEADLTVAEIEHIADVLGVQVTSLLSTEVAA